MDWQDVIELNPDVLSDKPIIKGTRLSVEFILEFFGAGFTEGELLKIIRS